MKKSNLVGLLALPLMVFALALPVRAADSTTTCKDGTTSTATGRGACSGHGGMQKATKSKPAADATTAAPAASVPAAAKSSTASTSAPATSAPTRAAGSGDPAGVTAKCKDGTYSKSQHHSGTCSKHGGVAEWLDAKK